MNNENENDVDSFLTRLIKGLIFIIVAVIIIWLASNLLGGLLWFVSGIATLIGMAVIISIIYVVGKKLIQESEKEK